MKIIDISWPIDENITEYKNKKTIKFTQIKKFPIDKVRESLITLCSHTGTHIDMPAHFLKNGKTTDRLDLNSIIGNCRILNLNHIEKKITKADLEKFDIKNDEIILLKTRNSRLPFFGEFYSNFVYLEKSGAQHLANKKVKCVGIDYLGIEREQPEHETHKILFENNIVIIEGLRLKSAKEKIYFLCCLPIFTTNLEAAPARAILEYFIFPF